MSIVKDWERERIALYRSDHRIDIPEPRPVGERVSPSVLDLSCRAKNALENLGIEDIAQLEFVTATMLRRLPNVGRLTALEIVEALDRRGNPLLLDHTPSQLQDMFIRAPANV